jgi:cell filamentation protein
MKLPSRYCYPGTDVLINKFNIHDAKHLQSIEKIMTSIKIGELRTKPIKGQFNIDHLKEIHKYIFGDIYPFAGEFRDVSIIKGNVRFANPLYIEENAKRLFQELKNENDLVGLDKDELSQRLAYYFAEINILHVFREGNGRTQREFIREVALLSGYDIDWRKISRDEYMNASKKSVYDTKPLENLIKKHLSPSRLIQK